MIWRRPRAYNNIALTPMLKHFSNMVYAAFLCPNCSREAQAGYLAQLVRIFVRVEYQFL